MICRIWRGWTSPQSADIYERVVRGQVIPGIEVRRVEGFRHIDLLRRTKDQEVEFATIMWFDDLAAVRRFMGDDYEASHVPAEARAVLARFDERAAHYDVVDRHAQDSRAPAET
jgi:heme-degrading monooxygenase HmoA